MLGLVTDTAFPGERTHAPALAPAPVVGVAALVDSSKPWANAHDRSSRDVLLRRVAAYLGVPACDPVVGADAADRDLLLVPWETLEQQVSHQAAIRSRHQILGGIVPAFFIGSKSITHGLISEDADRPPLWSSKMAGLMEDAALRGYTAFSLADAAQAGRRLLAIGPVRIKDVCGKAGLGQAVVRSEAELEAALGLEDDANLGRCGLVVEENLADVKTYSVGAVELGGRTISYWGSQNLTTDHKGREVYGGSDLFVVRGDLDALGELDLPDVLARAVSCAATFDAAAHAAYPDVLLTRRNYDVIEGVDASGERRVAVLEQSWRVGGATGAEIAALEALRDEPLTRSVRCSTVEVYDDVIPPSGATVYFRGVDPVVGAMTKFAIRTG